MNPAEYDRMFRNEDHYWWYVSRRELVVEMVRGLPLPEDPLLVDVGCGTGATAAALGAFGRVAGVDMSPLALERCRRRGLTHLMQGKAEAIPLASESADVIVATDILEHMDDDSAGLAEFRRVLKPGGFAVVTVPAYQCLWSEHDDALMHKRRYVSGQMANRVRESGLGLVRLSYALAFLLPLALSRLLKRGRPTGRAPEAQILPLPGPVNGLFIRFQRLETALLRRVSLPWGLSVLAVIQKPAPEMAVHRPKGLQRLTADRRSRAA
jgi:SAM-dependent methyltransferase